MSASRLEQLIALLNDSPKDAFLIFAIAKEYETLEQPDKALEHFLLLERIDPDYVGMYYHLGKLYESKNLPKHAFQTYNKGMTVAKKVGDQHAFRELAGARLALGDEEDFED